MFIRGVIREAALALWELPQNALGLATFAVHLARGSAGRVSRERGCVFVEVPIGAVSLGRFVFFSTVDSPFVPVGGENKDHEYGHSLQSRRYGPLYLAVVGVPSTLRVARAVAWKLEHGTRWSGYYDGFPEREADELGGVDRSLRPRP